MQHAPLVAGAALVASMLAGLSTEHTLASAAPAWRWNLPAHFKPPRVPADNPMSEEKFQLGRRLFYDTRLSGNGTQACASCHFQHLAFTDGKAVSTGSTGEETARNAPSIANSAWNPTLTWANYSILDLERHMLVPMFGENPVELGIDDSTRAKVLQRFRDDPDYQARFARAFGPGEAQISYAHLIQAISVFQRGVVSASSRYDQYLAGKLKLSEAEERGRALFFSEQAQCSTCHSGPTFSDQYADATTTPVRTPYHNTGLYNIDGKGAYPEPNRGILELSGKSEDMGAFRTQSLRNVAVTAPYMHDGSIATLEAVLDHYAAHGRTLASTAHAGDGSRNPFKDPRIDRIRLDSQDKADLIAFLKTLTDEELLTRARYANPFK
ncbi:methanobactin export MATE transporter MbnM [Zoogloea sp.]|uniref:methanobactin export MATE transporter MbnM n=1 Tax=Zoogloea sp. TaxID=49181 RepID=UPI0025CCA6FD|nr:methanobactin export MATE transporter MbnM [Zoogloea sp.]MCK6393022.1 di-heme enzyme [Zoogloea sp.]